MVPDRFVFLVVLPALSAGLCSSAAAAQSFPPGYLDPKPVLKAASDAIGVDRIRCLTASGAITGSRVGQQRYIQVEGDWPDDKLENFVRYMNWEAGAMREQFDRAPGITPASYKYGAGWTGGTPTQRYPRQMFAVNGKVGWHQDGPNSPPAAVPPDIAEMWQLDLWLNPVGFLKAAAMPGAEPIATWRWELGEMGRDGPTTIPEKVTVVSIKMLGKYRVDATINKENLIQRIHTSVAHPVLGDLNVEQEFTNDKFVDLGNGMKFPTRWHSHQGYDDNYGAQTVSSGHNAFDGNLPNIKVNDCADVVAVPNPLTPAPDPARVETQKLADGVYLLGGSSHNSVAVEFKDYIAVVEAPLNEKRSLAVIEEVVKLVPNKPIRFLVNTHQHFDHIGGLRTYLHIGATIITHVKNFNFYNNDVLNYAPRTVEPDLVSLAPPTELAEGYNIETIRENFTLTDGKRTMHINYVHPLKHAEGMLMVYLPVEKLVVEADLFDTHEPPPAEPSDGARILHRMIKTLKYDVDRIVPIHGLPIAWSEFLAKTGVEKQPSE
jgi:glyoxylase-like metal-dependent hydrolase (beta-lactamase superfamily II)